MKRGLAVVSLVAACGRPAAPGPEATPLAVAPSDADAEAAPDPIPDSPPDRPDPAEPTAPVIHCDVAAQPVFCEDGTPTITARQPHPFHWCASQLPSEATGALGTTERLFSAVETRRARVTAPEACCYLEWTWTLCR
jgi:hypothetical protein